MNRIRIMPLISLFTSASTLVCCALPALFVALGMGAVFAGLITQFPQLIWISENKEKVFLTAGLLLCAAGTAQYRARNEPCPLDPALALACDRTRRTSRWIYFISVTLYLVGAGFAFIPHFL